jgi:hypothetical protein
MTGRSSPPAPDAGVPPGAAVAAAGAVLLCSLYANLALFVERPADYRFFPPFRPGVNANRNAELGNECFNIAQALRAGRGFADPFRQPTGPTAWMPPLFPGILAGLLWVCDGDRDAVTAVSIFLQAAVVTGTGFLVLALGRQLAPRVGPWPAAAVFVVALVSHFHRCFQYASDCWVVLLMVDLLTAGLCWGRPLGGRWAAAGWGLFGGTAALASPVVGFTWAVLTCLTGSRQRAWGRLALAALAAALTVAPWTVRNYLVFGRLVPVKSNLAYELYQSQCLQPDGLLRWATFHSPAHEVQVQEYRTLGEAAFLVRKREQFWEAVRADPGEFLERVAERFWGATLWYEPYYRDEAPWAIWGKRLTQPWPFLGLVVLALTARRRPIPRAAWAVVGIYVVYLLPYVVVSYYERYAIPLVGVQVLLVLAAADRLLATKPPGHAGTPVLPGAGVGTLGGANAPPDEAAPACGWGTR